MKILLLGANGQLGQAFLELSESSSFPIGWSLTAWDRKHADLAHVDHFMEKVLDLSPDLIFNTAAYTQVDLAEKEKDLCSLINTAIPAQLAKYCANHGATLVHFSTDYVYGGSGNQPHDEAESLNPQNYYGKSKAQGDLAILESGCDYLIFRTSWVYSWVGRNFVKTMLKLGQERPELRVVEDQIGSPTYAPDLALYALDATMKALEAETRGAHFPSGIFHLANSGYVSWCEFARAILPKTKIVGISSTDYPTTAARPLNSRLSLEKFKNAFGVSPRPWREALNDCLKKSEANPC